MKKSEDVLSEYNAALYNINQVYDKHLARINCTTRKLMLIAVLGVIFIGVLIGGAVACMLYDMHTLAITLSILSLLCAAILIWELRNEFRDVESEYDALSVKYAAEVDSCAEVFSQEYERMSAYEAFNDDSALYNAFICPMQEAGYDSTTIADTCVALKKAATQQTFHSEICRLETEYNVKFNLK